MFLSKNYYLLIADTNERTITHQFAFYIQNEFPEYNIDCEYNRNGLDPKKLKSFKKVISSDNVNGDTVYPDIIVHHRGTNHNFIVIEAKKTSNYTNIKNHDNCHCDNCKLKAYKADLKYKYAFFILFPTGNELKRFKESSLRQYIKKI